MQITKNKKKWEPKQVLVNPNKPCLRVWTDGSCMRNPGGAGTYSFVITESEQALYEHGEHFRSTTNNRMEIMGVLNAIKYLELDYSTTQEQVVIYTDSQYVYKSIMAKKGKEANKNGDLLEKLKDAVSCNPHIQYMWTEGHAGKRWNEYADELCRKMYKKTAIPDSGYERLMPSAMLRRNIMPGQPVTAKQFLLESYLPTTSAEERELWFKCSDWARTVVQIMERYKQQR